MDTSVAEKSRRVAVHVAAGAERYLQQGHPWLFDRAIRSVSHKGSAGDLAVVYDRNNRFLAIGLYDPLSPIRVRVLAHRVPTDITPGWFHAKLAAAAARRDGLGRSSTTGYRVVHGENDGLPGLVVDRYDRTLVLKLYTAAWLPHLPSVTSALNAIIPSERVVLRLSRNIRQRGRKPTLADGAVLAGAKLEGPVQFSENGLRFEADPVHGHKTGFFLDQRENRKRLESFTRGKTVLDAFAYSGGFSVYAARGGARSVLSLDVSWPALKAAQRNMALNRSHPAVAAVQHDVQQADAFEAFRRYQSARRQYDVVVLDPPAFAKSAAEAGAALKAYERMTRLGLGALKPKGILMLSSCSAHISAEAFFMTVNRAARLAGRPLRERARTLHPNDHPIGFAEGAYLKCLFAQA